MRNLPVSLQVYEHQIGLASGAEFNPQKVDRATMIAEYPKIFLVGIFEIRIESNGTLELVSNMWTTAINIYI